MRKSFTVYTYKIQRDDETLIVEKPFQIDYKHTINAFKEKGYKKVRITFIGKSLYME